MTLIVFGLALWWGAHLFKRLAPSRRAALGDPGKGLVAVLVVAGVVLMVLGYRGAPHIDLWYPPAFLTHLNNLLMLFAVYLYAASGMKTRITRVIRHPQLTAVKTWAVAHLLVNGDVASVVLFGCILAWAVVEVILINRAEPRGPLPEPAPVGKEVGAVVGAGVVLVGSCWFTTGWGCHLGVEVGAGVSHPHTPVTPPHPRGVLFPSGSTILVEMSGVWRVHEAVPVPEFG